MKKKLVWIIQAHRGESPENRLFDVVTLEIFAQNEKQAIERAKELITREHYRVASIIEK